MAGPDLLIIGAIASAAQGAMAYKQGKDQAKSEKNAAAYNAQVTQQQGDVESARLKRQQRALQATQRVRGAGSGATLSSFEDTFEDTQANSLLDQALLDYDVKMKKQGIIYGGRQDAYSAKQKGTAGLISGLSNAATMGASAAGSGGTFTSGAQKNIGGQNVGTFQSKPGQFRGSY